MSFFKSLFGSKNSKDNKQTAELINDEKVIQYLQKLISEKNLTSEIVDNQLIIKDYKMSIKACIQSKTQHTEVMLLQMRFVINQELLEDEVVEVLAGIGENMEEAMKNGISSFITGIFDVFSEAFHESHIPDLDFETEWNGESRLWHPKIGPLQVQGDCNLALVDENKILNILKEDIKVSIGDNRFYWIKVYVSRQADGEIITECTLNNETFYKAESKMREYAEGFDNSNSFRGEKQYIIIRQCDKTWSSSKYSEKDLESFINKTIDMMGECSNSLQYRNLLGRIESLTKDLNLAFELYCFIPELYCRIALREVNYSEEIIIVMPNGEKKSMYLSQFSICRKIKKIIYKRIELGDSTEKLKKVIMLSASFGAINDAVMKGSKIADLAVGALIFSAPENYKPFS